MKNNNKLMTIIGSLLLFFATCVWGYAFVVQKQGMEILGPIWLTAWRFLLGGFALAPFVVFEITKTKRSASEWRYILKGAFMLGLFLSIAANFQQIALLFTSVANSGFITSTYVVLVPIIGLLVWRHHVIFGVWLGIIITFIGLCILSITPSFTINSGDFLTLISAIFWALHVLFVGQYVKHISPFLLAATQFLVCAFFSFIMALLFDKNVFNFSMLYEAKDTLFYLSIISVSVGYTVQIIAQKYVNPVPAAIILSLEAVTASIAGWYFLNEIFSTRAIIGCTLMLLGCLLAQTAPFIARYQAKRNHNRSTENTTCKAL